MRLGGKSPKDKLAAAIRPHAKEYRDASVDASEGLDRVVASLRKISKIDGVSAVHAEFLLGVARKIQGTSDGLRAASKILDGIV